MRFLRAMMLLGLGAAAAVAVDRWFLPQVVPTSAGPAIERTERGATDPPVVWMGGSLEQIGETQLILQDGEGPPIPVERFSGGATRFFEEDGASWRQLEEDQIESVEKGTDVCIEALADGEAFLALRVFLDRTCAPV